ncbi:zinc-ribbon domain-containing protein [Rhodobacter capsulatus]|uniref:zinc-ribbon domain-containing protein n=1 Tax=Rhodobacter capsulatus TaxID=1061 RepID=UPI00402A57DA
MRLICPRCGAQYEVDDVVIPAAGRDVQCSGCGQTWFQPSRAMLDAAAGDASLSGAPQDPDAAPEIAADQITADQIVADPEPEAWPEPRPEDWPEVDPAPEPAEPEPAGPEDEAEAPALEGLDWAVPQGPSEPEPEPADLDPAEVEADVTQAIAELMRAHPLSPPVEPEESPVPTFTPPPPAAAEAVPPAAPAARRPPAIWDRRRGPGRFRAARWMKT